MIQQAPMRAHSHARKHARMLAPLHAGAGTLATTRLRAANGHSHAPLHRGKGKACRHFTHKNVAPYPFHSNARSYGVPWAIANHDALHDFSLF
jgi:hypothetical protein